MSFLTRFLYFARWRYPMGLTLLLGLRTFMDWYWDFHNYWRPLNFLCNGFSVDFFKFVNNAVPKKNFGAARANWKPQSRYFLSNGTSIVMKVSVFSSGGSSVDTVLKYRHPIWSVTADDTIWTWIREWQNFCWISGSLRGIQCLCCPFRDSETPTFGKRPSSGLARLAIEINLLFILFSSTRMLHTNMRWSLRAGCTLQAFHA